MVPHINLLLDFQFSCAVPHSIPNYFTLLLQFAQLFLYLSTTNLATAQFAMHFSISLFLLLFMKTNTVFHKKINLILIEFISLDLTIDEIMNENLLNLECIFKRSG